MQDLQLHGVSNVKAGPLSSAPDSSLVRPAAVWRIGAGRRINARLFSKISQEGWRLPAASRDNKEPSAS